MPSYVPVLQVEGRPHGQVPMGRAFLPTVHQTAHGHAHQDVPRPARVVRTGQVFGGRGAEPRALFSRLQLNAGAVAQYSEVQTDKNFSLLLGGVGGVPAALNGLGKERNTLTFIE